MFKFLIKIFLISVFFNNFSFANENKIIKVIIPFAPGGGQDQTFKHIQKYGLEKNISFIPIYKPGADGMIGLEEFKLNTDPNVLLMGGVSLFALDRAKNPNTNIVPITLIRRTSMSIVVSPNLKVNTLKELESKLVDPGNVKIGSAATGQRLVVTQLLDKIKSNPNNILVNYKGTSQMLTDLAGNHIDMAVAPYAVVKPLLAPQKIEIVAITESVRGENLPVLSEIYKNWILVDGIGVATSSSLNKENLMFYEQFFKEYLSNEMVKQEIIRENYIPAVFEKTLIESLIKNSLKFYK